ncbi:MAG: hypothetical protein FWF28_03770 [Micrococcales bacterium]|nr:hypothetical protein [Micrococcales bacterium]
MERPALLESVNRNHPLLDGNRRLAWLLVRELYLSYDLAPLRLPPAGQIDVFIRQVAADAVALDDTVAWLRQVFDPDCG